MKFELLETAWMTNAQGECGFVKAGEIVGEGTDWPLTGAPSPTLHHPIDAAARAELRTRELAAGGE